MTITSGVILLWSGAIIDIPPGYVICDGNNGTPDLRNRFLVGAGDTYDPDDNGGAAVHNHVFGGDGHDHSIPGGTGLQSGAIVSDVTDTAFASGTTDNGSSLPPYFALAYIMKT